MKNKNFRKIKYVSGNPHLPYNFRGPWWPTDPQPKLFSLASLAVLHPLFQNSLLLLKMLKALLQINMPLQHLSQVN
jgi:hypothetical protein